MRTTLSLCVALAVILVAPAVVPEAAAQDPAPDFYGTADTNFHYVSAEEFQPKFGADYVYTEYGFWRAPNAGGIIAPLRLPSGALVDGFTVVYEDSNDDLFQLSVFLYRFWVGAFGATGESQIAFFHGTGSPGVTSTWVDLDPDLTIRYYISATLSTQSYAFMVDLPNYEDVQFRGVIVHWKRQISPAPGTATFPDVAPGFWAFQEIEALAASEITTGFPDGTFRPTAPVTRAQMATFLARALGLHWAP